MNENLNGLQERAEKIIRRPDGIILEDKFGNKVKVNKSGRVWLKLASEGGRVRDIGFWDGKIYRKEIRSARQVMRKFGGVGFNKRVLEILEPEALQVEYKGKIYFIRYNLFNLLKKKLMFKEQGFELQAFIKFKDMEVIP